MNRFSPQLISVASSSSEPQKYPADINVSIIGKNIIQETNATKLNLLIEIENKTSIKWEHPVFEVKFTSSDGELLNVERAKDYYLVIKPLETYESSIKIPYNEEFKDSEVNVIVSDIKKSRY